MKFIFRRLGFYLLALFVAISINFFLPRLLPGDPAAAILAPMGSRMSDSQIQSLRLALGLSDAPLGQQYVTYLSHLVQGDLGVSYSQFPAPVTSVIKTGLKWTLLLGSTSLIISAIIGHLIGIVGAWRRGSTFDVVMPPLFNFIGAFPAFFLALGILYYMGLKLHWFPISHAADDSIPPGWTMEYINTVVKHMAMPLLVSVLVTLQIWIQSMRNTMITVLAEDYITMAESKGLTQNRIMFNYAARNAILPTVTGFGIFLGSILSGQVLIEQVFSYPGLGFLLVRAVGARDYPLMGGLFLGITAGVLLVNFLVDILYTYLDPRVRSG
ncbi:MAG: ABC transporter permease [Ardenticatenaceae bacterium]|nr:ABC transporter permease [Ardenticatenaceae bacterium]MCB9443452.1 ABC transporter permease [Ardenticatenaceae bacterium]